MLRTLPTGTFHYLTAAAQPVLEIATASGDFAACELAPAGPGRFRGERLWVAQLPGHLVEFPWQFRVALGDGRLDHPEFAPVYATRLSAVWMQDQRLFGYRPAPAPTPSRVIKINGFHQESARRGRSSDRFRGAMSERALYVYLPRGYREHGDLRYPVLYMHDGQNCFEAFVQDSYVGSWQADLTADWLIRQGLMRECIIVGVSHGGRQRIWEYLPSYASLTARSGAGPAARAAGGSATPRLTPVRGTADRTLAYYRDEVAPYIGRHFRTLTGRDDTATCGSSMGGLFSLYIAWEHPNFARHHAALSTAFGITKNGDGRMEIVERMRTSPRCDLRLWLDSGTRSTRNRGQDDQVETMAARDALLEAGYVEGQDFCYYLAEGALHNEAAWAARLPLVFQFLFPP